MATDKSGSQGPRSTREPPSAGGSGSGGGGGGGGGGRFRQPDRRDGRDRDGPPGAISSANAAPLGNGNGKNNTAGSPMDPAPTVPNFNFPFSGSMPMFPGGFMMPGQAQGQQQAPPGAS